MPTSSGTHFKGPVYSQNGFSGGVSESSPDHLLLKSGVTASDQAGKTVRLNSINNTGTANSWIGFQSKPGQSTSMANNVIGGEISPRLNDAIALTGSGSLIGLHVDAYLKGTTGNVAGNVRVLQLENVDDSGSTRTVTGDEVGIRFRSAIEHTVTGTHCPMLVEVSEKSTAWEAVMKLTSTQSGVWHDTQTTATPAGFLKVLVNGNARYIQLYSGTPS